MPWLHLHIGTDGLVKACCNTNITYGDINKTSISDIWTGSEIKTFRKNLLLGVEDKRCASCFKKEAANKLSIRLETLSKFPHKMDWVNQTDKDGNCEPSQPIYLDIRFNNLCNLKCRTCWHGASSNWFEEAKKLKNNFGDKAIIAATKDSTHLITQLVDHEMAVEEVYFAGGEPLMMEEHYELLDELIKRGNTDVHLRYNSNLSFLKLKGKYVLDYWKNFSNITVSASIDSIGKKGEYIRKGLKWSVFEQNLKIIKMEAPHVQLEIAPTISVFNILDICGMHRYFVSEELIGVNDVYINLLTRPNFQNIKVLSRSLKLRVRETIESHIEWMREQNVKQALIEEYRALIDYMSEEDWSNQWPAFLKHTATLDGYRQEKFGDIYPEFI